MVDAKPKSSRKSFLERNTIEGDSPVFEDDMAGSERVGPPRLEV